VKLSKKYIYSSKTEDFLYSSKTEELLYSSKTVKNDHLVNTFKCLKSVWFQRVYRISLVNIFKKTWW